MFCDFRWSSETRQTYFRFTCFSLRLVLPGTLRAPAPSAKHAMLGHFQTKVASRLASHALQAPTVQVISCFKYFFWKSVAVHWELLVCVLPQLKCVIFSQYCVDSVLWFVRQISRFGWFWKIVINLSLKTMKILYDSKSVQGMFQNVRNFVAHGADSPKPPNFAALAVLVEDNDYILHPTSMK